MIKIKNDYRIIKKINLNDLLREYKNNIIDYFIGYEIINNTLYTLYINKYIYIVEIGVLIDIKDINDIKDIIKNLLV